MKHPTHHDHHHPAESKAHKHGHQHSHGHEHDRGLSGFLRYLRVLPRMWRSEVSTAVVGLVAPKPGERVVEIGAGMGAAMVVALRSGASVVAIDPTPYMRRILRFRRLTHLRPGRVSIADGAAESIPVAAGSADAVWSVNTMHHWGDVKGALREIHRVLRPGGRVLLVDEDFDDPTHPSHEQHKHRRAKHHHAFTEIEPSAMAAQLRALGFKSASGAVEKIAGRPAKVVRGVKV